MSGLLHRITNADQIDRLIAFAAGANAPHRAQLLRAVRQGRICLVELDRETEVSMRLLKQAGRPLIVLVGDDDYRSSGPTGWISAPRLLRWARQGLVHATGADVASYAFATEMAVACDRLLLIETASAQAVDWSTALANAPKPVPHITLMPSHGVHPILPSREAMQ